METFSVPFRFSKGHAVTHSADSDEYYLHLISMVILTQPGEMPLVPNFGTLDPTFERVNRASLIELALKYVPEVNINRITPVISDDGSENILVEYSRG